MFCEVQDLSNGTSYQVLALKYRPQTFSELTGQEHVSCTLQNAIESGRVAHAFLFTGARGVGKTSTCLLYTSPSPRDGLLSRMPSSA